MHPREPAGPTAVRLGPHRHLEDTVTVARAVVAVDGPPGSGTSSVSAPLYYQYNNGAWVFWQTFSGQTTSTQFNFQQVNPALGDGFSAFAVTARNNLNQQQPFNNVAQASVILDLADKMQPASFMPLISR